MGEAKRKRANRDVVEFFSTPAVRVIQRYRRANDPAYIWLTDVMNAGKRFHLPYGGNLLDMDTRESLFSGSYEIYMNAPFPNTVAEFQLPDYNDEFNRFVTVTMLELREELRDKLFEICGPAPEFLDEYNALRHLEKDMLYEWTALILASIADGEGTINACPSVVFIRRCDVSLCKEAEGLRIGHRNGKQLIETGSIIVARILPDLLRLAEIAPTPSNKAQLEELLDDLYMGDELPQMTTMALQIFTDLCMVLNCSNVTAHAHIPPASILPSSRLETPYSEFRTLVVDGRPIDAGEEGQHDTGHVGKPKKAHFRRGHPRHLSDGRSIWVRSCEVGARQLGTVQKVYNMLRA